MSDREPRTPGEALRREAWCEYEDATRNERIAERLRSRDVN